MLFKQAEAVSQLLAVQAAHQIACGHWKPLTGRLFNVLAKSGSGRDAGQGRSQQADINGVFFAQPVSQLGSRDIAHRLCAELGNAVCQTSADTEAGLWVDRANRSEPAFRIGADSNLLLQAFQLGYRFCSGSGQDEAKHTGDLHLPQRERWRRSGEQFHYLGPDPFFRDSAEAIRVLSDGLKSRFVHAVRRGGKVGVKPKEAQYPQKILLNTRVWTADKTDPPVLQVAQRTQRIAQIAVIISIERIYCEVSAYGVFFNTICILDFRAPAISAVISSETRDFDGSPIDDDPHSAETVAI